MHALLSLTALPPFRLAEIEFRLASGASEKMNVGSLVGAFQQAKEALFQERDRALGREAGTQASAHTSSTSSGGVGSSQDPMVIT